MGARFFKYVDFNNGPYDFWTFADDWNRMRLNDQVMVDNWNGANKHNQSYSLFGRYGVTIEFADRAGLASVGA